MNKKHMPFKRFLILLLITTMFIENSLVNNVHATPYTYSEEIDKDKQGNNKVKEDIQADNLDTDDTLIKGEESNTIEESELPSQVEETEDEEVSPTPVPTELPAEAEVTPSTSPVEEEEEVQEEEDVDGEIYEDWTVSEITELDKDLEVGDLIVESMLSLNGHKLIVHGDIIIRPSSSNSVDSNCITFNRGYLECKGSLDLYDNNYSYIEMNYPEDYLVIEGNLSTYGAVEGYVFPPAHYFFEEPNHKEIVNTLTDGIIELKGDLFVGKRSLFITAEEHNFILSGTREQIIDVKGLLCHFANIEIKNYSLEGIVSNVELSADNLITNECNVSISSEYTGWTLYEDQVIEGDLYLNSGELDLNGHKLTVNGDFIHSDGVLNVNGGYIHIDGDCCMATYKVVEEEIVCIEGSGTLKMVNPEEYVYIGGSFIADSSQWNKELLTEGTIEVVRNISRGADNVETMFETSNNHKIYLSAGWTMGNERENYKISETLPYVNSFANLTVENYAEIKNETMVTNNLAAAHIEGDIYLGKNINLTGHTYIHGTMYFDETLLDFNGFELMLYGETNGPGQINVNKGSLSIYDFYLSDKSDSYGKTKILEQDIDIDHGDVCVGYSDVNIYGDINVGGGELRLIYNPTFYGDVDISEGNLIVSGETTINGNMDVNGGRAELYGDTIIDGSINLGGGILKIYGDTTINSNINVGGGTFEIYYPTIINADINLDGGEFNIYGDTTINSTIDLEGGIFTIRGGSGITTVTGNIDVNKGLFECYNTILMKEPTKGNYLTMVNSEDRVIIHGDYIADTGYAEALTEGILEVKGNFIQRHRDDSFDKFSEGNHKVILSGERPQVIGLDDWFEFATLELKNGIDEIYSNTPISAKNLINNGQNIIEDPNIFVGFTLYEDMVWEGDLHLYGGAIDLNGHNLTVTGDFHWMNSYLYFLDDSELIIEGDFITPMKHETEQYRYCRTVIDSEESNSNSKHHISVNGDFIINYDKNVGFIWNDLIVNLKGDFIISDLEAGSSSYNGPSLILSSEKKQSIITEGKRLTLDKMIITNTSDEGVVIDDNIYISDKAKNISGNISGTGIISVSDLSIIDECWNGSINVSSRSSLSDNIVITGVLTTSPYYNIDLKGYNLEVGELLATDGRIEINEGSLKCRGNLTIDSDAQLYMNNPSDEVFVGRDFTIKSNKFSSLTDGILTIQGDFNQSNYRSNFVPTKNHNTILDGKNSHDGSVQNIYFTNPRYSKFNDLTITRGLNVGYIFSTNVDDICENLIRDYVDETPPSKVEGLKADYVTDVMINLSWEPSTDENGVNGYHIYQNDIKIADINETSYKNIELEYNSNYTYYIVAYDDLGNLSEPSESITVSAIADIEAPTVPSNVRIKYKTGSSIIISWGISSDNVGVTGYEIYRGDELIATVDSGTEYKDITVQKDEIYEYRLKALDKAGNKSDFSNAVKGSTVMPKIIRMEPEDYSKVGGELINLRLLFANSGNSIGNQVKFEYRTKDSEYTSFSDNLQEQRRYSYNTLYAEYNWDTKDFDSGTYDIRATLYDADGNTDSIEVQYILDKTPPMAPGAALAVSENGTVDIGWTPSISSDCTYYTIYRLKQGDEEFAKIATVNGRFNISYLDKDVTEGEIVEYKITASDEFDQESEGVETLPITVEEDKEPPRILSISPTDTRISGEVKINIEVTDNYDVDTVSIEYKDENSDEWIALETTRAEDNTAEFTWDTSELDGVYILRATATDYNGNINEDEFIKRYEIDNTGIEKININNVVSNITSVSLQWDDVTEEDFAYFQVEQKVEEDFKVIGSTSDTLGMHIRNLEDNTAYIFRVVAYDDIGNRGIPSDEIEVKTLEDTISPIITRILPVSSYYNENIKLEATINDNIGAVEAEFFFSIDENTWTSLSKVQAKTIKPSNTFTYNFDTSELEEGNVYIKVITKDAAGNQSSIGEEGEPITYVIDRTAPAKVENLKAEGKDGYVSLTWDNSPDEDIAGYRIYRADETGEYKIIKKETSTYNYFDKTAIYGKEYKYCIAAIDIAGNVGTMSDASEVSITKDTQAPTIHGMGPVENTVIGSNPTITILVSDNVSVKELEVTFQKEGSESWSPIEIISQEDMDGITEIVWDTKKLTDGKYNIAVIARDAVGNESETYQTSYVLDLTAPKEPEVSLTKDNWNIKLLWDKSEDDDFESYHILKKKDNDSEFKLVDKITKNAYEDNDVIPLENYTYKIRAYDRCGNYSESDEITGYAYSKDTINPVARTSTKMVGIAGMEMAFDGSASTDNVRVTEFIWDMGNGDIITGARPLYTYDESGEYEVTLTVKDKEGNSDIATICVTVLEPTQAGTVKVKVVDSFGDYIPEASIYVNNSANKNSKYTTDINGELSFSANADVYKIAAYKEGYLPNDVEVIIKSYDKQSITITLQKKELITGNLTSKRMNLQEMVDAGIDLDNPANYETFIFSVDLTFEQHPQVQEYIFAGNSYSCNVIKAPSGGPGDPRNIYGGSDLQIKPMGVSDKGEPILAYIHTQQSISWLKEMYEVTLGILNNASPGYVITDSIAKLDLPDGLTLLSTDNGQGLTMQMEDINGQEQKSVSWYVRGDEPGDYDLSASFDGTLMPFEEKIHADFVTSTPISVTSGEGLHIYISPEEAGYIGEDYYIQFRVTNESDRIFYNLTTDFGDYTSPGYVEEHTIIDHRTGKTIMEPYEGETYCIPEANKSGTLPVIKNGDVIEVEALLPGESVYGTYHTTFNGEGDPKEVYYKLIDSLVEVLSGENTGVQVHVQPIPCHINKYTTHIIPANSLWADPVDMASGAFLSELEAISINGLTQISLDIDYNSLMTEEVGDLGKGWSHNFENYIVDEGGTINVYWSPSSYSTFVRTDAVKKTVYGYKVNEKIVLSDNEQSGEEEYTCISANMEGTKLIRNEDGTYKLTFVNQSIYRFNSSGEITQMTDSNGRSIHLNHSDNKFTVTEKETGKQLTVNYNSNGLISSVEDQTGRSTKFYYTNQCLTKITNPLGESIYYTYDENGRILTAKNNDNVVFVTNTYDDKGRVLTQDDADASTPLTYFNYTETSEYESNITNITDRNGESLEIVSNMQGDIIRTTNQNGETVVDNYDSDGNILNSRDDENNVIQYSYDNKGNLTKMVDAHGIVTSLSYDKRGNLISVKSNGSTSTNTYNDKNLLTSTVSANGKKTSYTYNDGGQVLTETVEGLGTINYKYENYLLTQITDYKGNTTKFAYDDRGNIISITDREGATTTFKFDGLNRKISETNALGEVTEYEYNCTGEQTSIKYPTGDINKFTYNNNNYLSQAQYVDGEIIKYVSDPEGRLTKQINPDGTFTKMSYDAVGNLIKETNENGDETTYTYDSNANLLSTTAANGAVTKYSYYPNGKLYQTRYDDGSRMIYLYDAQWRLIKETNHLGHSISYEYDKAGNIICQKDPLGNEYNFEYDLYDNLIKETDPNGNTTVHSYDANGNCIKTVDALDGITEYKYDKENRVTSIIRHGSSGNEVITYEYDALGRVISVTDGEGAKAQVKYDKSGNISSVIDAKGITTSQTTYDKMGNPTAIKDAFGNTTTNSYDSMGNLIEIITNVDTDVEAKSKHSYDKLGRLLEVEDAENGISKYGYDKMGNITSLTDPNGGLTAYEYDKMGRLLLESNAIGSEKSYTYNAVGLLEESINGRKQVAIYKYDDAGRITSITDELGTTSYTYDANGNILTVSDDKGTISRKYDALNRVTEYTDYKGNTVKYSYDELGNLISLTYPGGEIVRYTYNLNGQINEVIDWQDRITTYEYDLNGRLTKVNRPEGSIETYEYDKAGRIISQENKNGNEIINHYTYAYDEASNIIEKTSTEEGSAKNLKSSTMKYDKANRLISYNDQEVRYDDDGNMTYGPLDGEMTEFVYDCRNRLISAGNLSYEYDAENNRIAIIDSKENTRTEFVTNTNTSLSQVLTEKSYKLDNDGNIIDTDNDNLSTTNYIHGLGLIAQENSKGGYLTYHYDHLGSTTAITDETGKVIHTYTYGPYGELLSGDAKNIRFLYNGMYGVSTDSNGLYYMRARYYNVDIKRFISQDILTGSISNSPSLNRYSYVQGNPISLTDPFGLSPDISWRGVGHAILDLLGCVPVVGFAFDLVNAGWYLAEGDNFGFVTSLISAVPGAGSFVGNKIKYGVKASKKLMLAGDLIINSTKMIGHGATFVRGTYGVVVSGGRIVTDIKDGKDVNPWDVLQLGLSGTAVGISGKGMIISTGATIDNVKGLNELRVSKGAVGGSDQLIKMDLQFFASSKNSKGGSEAVPKPYTNSRPSYRNGVVDQVWENAKGPDGFVRDPNTGDIINWTPGEPRKGVWDMGHIPGEKYSDMHDLYMNGDISKNEFLDWFNEPNNYRPELPSNNRSHRYE